MEHIVFKVGEDATERYHGPHQAASIKNLFPNGSAVLTLFAEGGDMLPSGSNAMSNDPSKTRPTPFFLDRPFQSRPNVAGQVFSPAITSVKDIGTLVRSYRKVARMSQQELADLAGVGRRFLSELENGKATVAFGLVIKVTSALGIDLVTRRR
jgi:y4mF family transcriptional regulator